MTCFLLLPAKCFAVHREVCDICILYELQIISTLAINAGENVRQSSSEKSVFECMVCFNIYEIFKFELKNNKYFTGIFWNCFPRKSDLYKTPIV